MKKKGFTLTEIIIIGMLLVIIVLALILGISGCAKRVQTLESGIVTDKECTEPKEMYYELFDGFLIPIRTKGKYYLQIENDEGKKDTFKVSYEEYNNYSLGDTYPK